MSQRMLPEFRQAGLRRVRAWSAACSTGAEPYTMAMVLQDYMERQGGPDYEILGTDLSTDVLEAAHRGIYASEMIAPVPDEMRRRWVMTARDDKRREVRIHPSLRAKLALARLNLMDDSYAVGDPFDFIMCRNVMIYFDKGTQARILDRFAPLLKHDGLLFAGHSESFSYISECFRLRGQTVYTLADR